MATRDPQALPAAGGCKQRIIPSTLRKAVVGAALSGARSSFIYAAVLSLLLLAVLFLGALGIAMRANIGRGVDAVTALGGAANIVLYIASAVGIVVFGSLYCAVTGGLLMGFVAAVRFRRRKRP